jgi:hypothetical protein
MTRLRLRRDVLLAVGSFFVGTIRTAGIKTLATSLGTSPAGALRELHRVNEELELLRREPAAIGDPSDFDLECR